MAAATVVGKRREVVLGSVRAVLVTISIVNNGDTYNTGMKTIFVASVDATSNTAIGFTKSGGTLTFVYGGGALTMDVIAFGIA